MGVSAPSCEKKKVLWTEWLRENVTIPRLLRPLFRRRRELLGELAPREILRVAEAGEGWGVPASWD